MASDSGLNDCIPFPTRNCRKKWNFGTECRKCGKVELGETSPHMSVCVHSTRRGLMSHNVHSTGGVTL